MELVRVEGLVRRFGAMTAVDNVSFTVRRGEVLGFLGPNGAGKSTTMKVLAGFLPPTEGRAFVCGFDVAQQPLKAREALGYLPEGAPLYGEMTPLEFLHFIAEMRSLPRARRQERVAAAAAELQLHSVLDRPIETLSKGFRRRVGFAQAILHDPDVLILDEPTDGLDPNQKHQVRVLIDRLRPTKAIIVSTHILEEVDAVCSRAIVIGGGRVLADGTPDELRARHGTADLEQVFRRLTLGRAQAATA